LLMRSAKQPILDFAPDGARDLAAREPDILELAVAHHAKLGDCRLLDAPGDVGQPPLLQAGRQPTYPWLGYALRRGGPGEHRTHRHLHHLLATYNAARPVARGCLSSCSRTDLAAEVDAANDRKPSCFVRNADFGVLGATGQPAIETSYAGGPGEVFEKGLICPRDFLHALACGPPPAAWPARSPPAAAKADPWTPSPTCCASCVSRAVYFFTPSSPRLGASARSSSRRIAARCSTASIPSFSTTTCSRAGCARRSRISSRSISRPVRSSSFPTTMHTFWEATSTCRRWRRERSCARRWMADFW